MAITFETLIEHNKRVSIFLVAGLSLFLVILCGLFGASYSEFFPSRDPVQGFLYGGMLAAGFSVVGAGASYFWGDKIIQLVSDGYTVQPWEDKVLFNVVEEVAIAAGVPPPKIIAIYDESPNAFATGRDPQHAMIGITTGLRAKLSRDELQAVIAHEMAHIKNYDIRLMMLVAVFAGIIVLFSDFFFRAYFDRFKMGALRRNYEPGGSYPKKSTAIYLPLAIAAVILSFLAPIFANLLQLCISREREYLADATAVRFTRNPQALIDALRKISLDEKALHCDNRATEHLFIVNPNPKLRLARPDADSIWHTHPPLIKRIARLRKLLGPEKET